MLIDGYKDNELLWASNVNGATSESGKYAFRGDLVITLGKMHEASQTRNPPEAIFNDCNLLFADGKWVFGGGYVNKLEEVASLVERYGDDFADDALLIFYVVNATKDMKTSINGKSFFVRTFPEGTTWQTMMDDLYLEKSDFKKKSPEDKMLVMSEAAGDFDAKAEELSWEDASKNVGDIVREVHGAI